MDELGTCLDTAITTECAWISGHNDVSFSGKTWSECKEACCNDQKCKSFDFNTNKEKCQLSYVSRAEVQDSFKFETICSTDPWSYTEIGRARMTSYY